MSVSKIEKMIRTALQQVKVVNLSASWYVLSQRYARAIYRQAIRYCDESPPQV